MLPRSSAGVRRDSLDIDNIEHNQLGRSAGSFDRVSEGDRLHLGWKEAVLQLRRLAIYRGLVEAMPLSPSQQNGGCGCSFQPEQLSLKPGRCISLGFGALHILDHYCPVKI